MVAAARAKGSLPVTDDESIGASECEPPEVGTVDDAPRTGLLAIVSRLSLPAFGQAFLSLVTGPLQARALGPVGRGELASVIATLTVMPAIVGLGLNTYALWAVAQGRAVGRVLTTTVLISGLAAVPLMLLSWPIATALAGGHHTVAVFILIGLLLLPVTLALNIAYDISVGLQLWRPVVMTRWLSIGASSGATILLLALGKLTVTTGSVIFVVAGIVNFLPVVAAVSRLSLTPLRAASSVAREGLSYGSKVWIWGIATTANGQLDQVLLLPLSGARQLGLYAIATTIPSIFVSILVGPLQAAVLSRVSGGNSDSLHITMRILTLIAVLEGIGGAIAGPFLIDILFGAQFSGATPMLWVLLGASVFTSYNIILTAACSGAGRPEIGAWAEGGALAITIPGLFLFAPSYGGFGAAVVTLLAYAATSAYLLRKSADIFGGRPRDFVVPRRSDLASLRAAVAPLARSAQQRWF
jgi:O-antigen/teichoic acid export membrane protein